MFIAQVMQKGFTAIFILVFSQLLSLRLFGELMLAMTFMNLMTVISLIGLPASLQKFCSGKNLPNVKEQFNRIASLGLLFTLSSSALIGYFYQPIARLLEPSESFANLIGYAAVGIFILGINRLSHETLCARENGQAYLLADNLQSILKIGLPVAAYFIFNTVSSVMGGLVIAYAISTFWILRQINQESLQLHFRLVSISTALPILGFALPAWLAGFTYVLAQHVDKLMLGALSRAESVGLYAAASAIAMLLTLFHTAFSSIFSPIAADLNRQGKDRELHLEYLWISNWSLFLCGIGMLVFAGFGCHFLHIFGQEFATPALYWVLILLSLFYFTSSAFGPTAPVLQMCGSNLLESFNAIAFLVINIVANLLMIPKYGVIGAAGATLIAGVCRLGLQWAQLRYRHGFQIMSLSSFLVMLMVSGFTLWAASAPMYSFERIAIAAAGLVALCISHGQSIGSRERNIFKMLKDDNFNVFSIVKKKAQQ